MERICTFILHYLSCIPLVGTAVNLVDIFQKCVILPAMQCLNVKKGHYYTYLENKTFKDCVGLLVPFFGTVLGIAIYFIKNSEHAKEAAFNGFKAEIRADESLKNNPVYMRAKIREVDDAFLYIGSDLSKNESFMLSVISSASHRFHGVFAKADSSLRENKEFILKVINQAPQVYAVAFAIRNTPLAQDADIQAAIEARKEENKTIITEAFDNGEMGIHISAYRLRRHRRQERKG